MNQQIEARQETVPDNALEQTWARYTSSWKAATETEKRALYEGSLDLGCRYTDPLIETAGWDELATYMLDFHKQIPGGHFVTTYFLAHHDRSVAKWNMVTADGDILGDGVSYGEYDSQGKLTSMTGFFETPQS